MNTKMVFTEPPNKKMQDDIYVLMSILDYETQGAGVELKRELRPFIEYVLRKALTD